jgi:hypothetical protein
MTSTLENLHLDILSCIIYAYPDSASSILNKLTMVSKNMKKLCSLTAIHRKAFPLHVREKKCTAQENCHYVSEFGDEKALYATHCVFHRIKTMVPKRTFQITFEYGEKILKNLLRRGHTEMIKILFERKKKKCFNRHHIYVALREGRLGTCRHILRCLKLEEHISFLEPTLIWYYMTGNQVGIITCLALGVRLTASSVYSWAFANPTTLHDYFDIVLNPEMFCLDTPNWEMRLACYFQLTRVVQYLKDAGCPFDRWCLEMNLCFTSQTDRKKTLAEIDVVFNQLLPLSSPQSVLIGFVFEAHPSYVERMVRYLISYQIGHICELVHSACDCIMENLKEDAWHTLKRYQSTFNILRVELYSSVFMDFAVTWGAWHSMFQLDVKGVKCTPSARLPDSSIIFTTYASRIALLIRIGYNFKPNELHHVFYRAIGDPILYQPLSRSNLFPLFNTWLTGIPVTRIESPSP